MGFINRKNNKQNLWNIEILQKSNLRTLTQVLNDVNEKWSSWFSYSRYRNNDTRKATKWTRNQLAEAVSWSSKSADKINAAKVFGTNGKAVKWIS